MKTYLAKTNIKKKAMLEALQQTLGVVTPACEIVGISRITHYEWMKTDENYKKSVDDIANIAIDFAESKLYSQIKNGDTTATIFYLKTKGKTRGYIERTEFDHTTNGKELHQSIQVEIIDRREQVESHEDTDDKNIQGS
jgi:hypothetical protein